LSLASLRSHSGLAPAALALVAVEGLLAGARLVSGANDWLQAGFAALTSKANELEEHP
jgi:xanthosine utilization system XapX-like protein